MAKNREAGLLKLEERYRKERRKIQNNDQLSAGYKAELLRKTHKEYVEKRTAEEQRIRDEMEAESARAYKKVNKREIAAGSLEQELRVANVREELMAELKSGGSPIRLYEEAARVDDDVRLRLLSMVGPGFIDSAAEKMRFQQMVREREPADVKRARKVLEANGRETFVFDTASAIRKGLNTRRERRLAKPTPSTAGYDWNTPIPDPVEE